MSSKKIILCLLLFAISIKSSSQSSLGSNEGIKQSQAFQELNKELSLLYQKGNYKYAIIVAEKAKDIAFVDFGIKDSIYLDLLFKIGILNSKLDNNKKAEYYYLQGIIIYKDSFLTKDLAYGNLVYNLGNIYARLQQYNLAEKYFVETFELFSTLNKLPPDYLTFLSNFGFIYSKLDNYKKAEFYYFAALNLYLKTSNVKDGDYRTFLNNLGGLYLKMGDYSKSETFYTEALSLYKKDLEPNSIDYALSLNNLGQLYAHMGDFKKAEKLSLDAMNIYKKLLGSENADYALSLNNLGQLYSDMGNYKKSESYNLESLAIRKKTLGVLHPDYALSLNNLGALYSTIGDYKKAEIYYRESQSIWEKVSGKESLDYALSLNNLGDLYSNKGNYEQAELSYLQALTINKKILGTEHPDYALALNNLGMVYLEKGEFEKAESSFLESSAIWKKAFGIKHPDYALSLNNLGRLYSDMGEYSKAESYYMDALTIKKNLFGTEHPAYADALNNLSALYSAMGELQKSESYSLEALAIRKKIFGIEHPDYALSLNNLGEIYFDKGDYKKAEPYYLESLSLRKKILGTEHPLYAASLSNLGKFYFTIGDYNKAEAYTLEALTISKKVWGTDALSNAIILNNLGVFYTNTEDYKKAESFLREALDIRKKTLGTEHSEYAQSLDNLSSYYLKINDYKTAETYNIEALAIRKKVFGSEHPSYALSLNNLGTIYLKKGEYDKAKSYYLQASNIWKSALGKQHPNYAFSLNNLGLLYYQTKNFSLSLSNLNQALSITNNNTKMNFDFLGEQEKSAYLKTISIYFDIYRSVFYSGFPESLNELTTLFDNELQKKGQVLNSSLSVRNAIFKNNDSSLITTWNQLTEHKRQLSKIYTLSKDKYPEDMGSIEEETNNLDKKLVSESQAYRSLNSKLQITSKTIQQNLKINEAAIEFISFPYYSTTGPIDSILYAALIQRPGYIQPKYVFLFEEKELSSVIQKSTGELDQTYINNLYKLKDGNNPLTQLIWEPLDSLLQGVSTLYAAPSGLLHKIALGAIPTNDGNTIASKYGLQILGTTGDIVNKQEDFIDKKSVEEAIVFGGINYDVASTKPFDFKTNDDNKVNAYVPTDSTRGANGKWNYLGASLNEAQEIAKEFKEQKIITHFYSDSTATETLFKNMPVKSNSIIHIATHGYFFPDVKRKKEDNMVMIGEEKQTAFKASENPLLRSGLIFAGANPAWTNPDYVSTATDDGILTAYEISNMDLSNVKLVVLSACETGLGDIKASEGVFGLQRSFKLAGVKNIIMSLWKVPDEKTRELMQAFYQFCFRGKSVSDAFKVAQETMRIKYPASPYYWAGFILLQ